MTRILLIVLILVTTNTSAIAAKKALIHVSATVAGDCGISATPISFATYDRVAGNTSNATVTTNCTNELNAEITLNNGLNETRKMSNGTSALSYRLYKDKAFTQEWSATSGLNIVGRGIDDVHVLYGRLEPGQNASAGNYSDTITATVIFAP